MVQLQHERRRTFCPDQIWNNSKPPVAHRFSAQINLISVALTRPHGAINTTPTGIGSPSFFPAQTFLSRLDLLGWLRLADMVV